MVNGEADGVNYDARVRSAIRFGKVPEGKLLVMEHGSRWQERIIRLIDPPSWMTAELSTITIPDTLRRPHPVVAALKTERERLDMAGAVRSRTLRVLQALATEAETRGHGVAIALHSSSRYGRRQDHPDELLRFTVQGHEFGLAVFEKVVRQPHVPTVNEQRRAERDSWFRIPSYDQVRSGCAAFAVTNGREYRRSVWTDENTGRMEHDLAELLQELELRAGFAEEQRLEAERRAADERRRWEAAMRTARGKLREAHRAKVLEAQLERWDRTRTLDAYLAAMQETVERLENADERAAAEEWLAWARMYRSSLDPLNGPLAVPETPQPTAENLEPFLGRWSFYGPHRCGAW